MATISENDPLLLSAPDRSGYTDPDVFQAEQRLFFGRRWVLVCRGAEMPEPGDYLTVNVAGESVIIVRQDDGGVRAMLNICRHRGARILLDESGNCPHMIRCPYHSWSYGLDGQLKGAPNLRDSVGPAQASLGLQAVAVREVYGSIWVNLDPEARSFEDDIDQQLRDRFGDERAMADWGLDRLVIGRQIKYQVKSNWKLVVENFMECYHCSSIHPELVNVIPEFKAGLASQAKPVGQGSPMGDDINGFTIDGRPGLPAMPHLGEGRERTYYAITLFANTFVNLFDECVVQHHYHPLAPNLTEVVCDWLFAPEQLADGADIGPTVELFDVVNRQDFEACERCQLGASSRVYAHNNVLVPAEHHLRRLHDELAVALGAG